MSATLTPAGQELRARLAAEAGVELTPEQLQEALLESFVFLLDEYPDGQCTLTAWAVALEQAIRHRRVR